MSFPQQTAGHPVRKYNVRDKINHMAKKATKKKEARPYQTSSIKLGNVNIAIRHTKKEHRRQQKLLAALAKSSQLLGIERGMAAILARVAETIGRALGAKYVNFWDYMPGNNAVFIVAAYGMQKQYIAHSKKRPLQLGTAWVGRAVKTGKTWATNDVQRDPRLPRSWLPVVKKQNYHGLICMPLKIKNKIFGGMCIYYKEKHVFDPFEMTIATIVANQAATVVENARIFGELRVEQQKTSSIIYSLGDGLIMYNLAGEVIFFNPKASELLWLKADDVLGRKIDARFGEKSVYHKNLYRIRSLTQRKFEAKEYTTAGPQRVVLEIRRISVHDSKHAKIGEMQVLRDITREKEVELMKMSFVTVASHQLRTPLSQIKWGLDALLTSETEPPAKSQKDILMKTSTINDHMIRLVSDLLDVSRIEEGRLGYRFSFKDVLAMVKKIFSNRASYAEKTGVHFVIKKPISPLPRASIDTNKLELAISNIVDNALKYTRRDGRVAISFRANQHSLSIVVQDTGIGIPEKDQKFIFIKFFRANNAVALDPQGSGLGLYIAQSIVEKHAGRIYFSSKENKGSTFVIELPLDPEKMPKGTIEGL